MSYSSRLSISDEMVERAYEAWAHYEVRLSESPHPAMRAALEAALAESAPEEGCGKPGCPICDPLPSPETERDAALRFLERMGWPSYVTDAIRAMPLDALEKRLENAGLETVRRAIDVVCDHNPNDPYAGDDSQVVELTVGDLRAILIDALHVEVKP